VRGLVLPKNLNWRWRRGCTSAARELAHGRSCGDFMITVNFSLWLFLTRHGFLMILPSQTWQGRHNSGLAAEAQVSLFGQQLSNCERGSGLLYLDSALWFSKPSSKPSLLLQLLHQFSKSFNAL
jgi:hypothetical protein